MFRSHYHPTGFTFPTGSRVALYFYMLALVSVLSVAGPASAGKPDTWILVDTSASSLSVMQGDVARRNYLNISIGRAGTTSEKTRGDGKTPLGEFHITRISTHTPFRRFFGLDYPDLQRAEQARRTGAIDQTRYTEIRRALRSRQPPPQDTALGGYIGIHGLGKADAAIHEDFNWTYGCIALTNEQIDDLSNWLVIGTKVIIRH